MAEPAEDVINDPPMPLLAHLVELRRRLMWAVGDALHHLPGLLPFLRGYLLVPGAAAGRYPGDAGRGLTGI